MHNIFIIKELLEHILSFIPRKLILPCAFTCKSFYYAIAIDYNQDTVAQNSDIFSLLKIPHSPIAVINIANKYDNNDMIKYLLEINTNLLDDDNICQIIGNIGDEYLLNKLSDGKLSAAVIGICEGLCVDLFEKYKDKLYYGSHLFFSVKNVYKMNCDEMINNVIGYVIPKFPENIDDIGYAEIVGSCARRNENDVLLYIKKFILTDKFTMDPDYFLDYISCIGDGLIEGEHYDTFVWFTNEMIKDNGEYYCNYYCENETTIKILIINNNLKMFQYVLLNNCRKWHNENYYIALNKWTYGNSDYIDFFELAYYCIDYRRIEILTFLINHIRFNLTRYQGFLNKSQSLKFGDITNVLISNKHLFIDYRE